jgi:hypothetical protein
VEDALRDTTPPDYLSEWFEIVHSDNVAKNQIPRYGRVFELQHWVRALYARQQTALHRKKSHLILALAGFYDVSKDSIERDLRFITDRLGAESYLPPA